MEKQLHTKPVGRPGLFAPARREPETRRGSRRPPSLPSDLRQQATRRLQATAFAYSIAFTLADFVPTLFAPDDWDRFRSPAGWVPSALAILSGVVVGIVVPNARMSWSTRVHFGLGFQVAGSYGIAIAQTIGVAAGEVTMLMLHTLSPGWVSVWMVFYAVVVPAPPGRALLAALGSATAVPVMLLILLGPGRLWSITPPTLFFFHIVFPFLICVLLAFIGARVIHQLGADVSRARELGSYRLEHRLGAGGMGEVWRASHRLLARPAAIKFIRPEAITGANPAEARALVRRFELEAHATASLTSPHTVSLYDFGTTDDGAFYYVMELLEGLDLEELVRRFGPLPPARVTHLVAQACESLEEAHARGLIHRDIKPANIYTCRSGSRYDFVKVLDFGLVATPGPLSAGEAPLTQAEEMAATPEFMAPEMARGDKFDGRADLYALGCVAYWLATGRLVFRGKSLFEIVSQHLQATPEPPSLHAPNPMPEELERLILSCLAKDPEDRPPSARALGERLRALRLMGWGEDDAERWWLAHLATEVAVQRTASRNLESAASGSDSR